MVLFLVLVLILVLVYYNKPKNKTKTRTKEYLSDIQPTDMTDDDFNKLITNIERASLIKQRYGSFRKQYPWVITPWQYNKLILFKTRGELTPETAKNIVLKNFAPDLSKISKTLGNATLDGDSFDFD